MKIRWAPVVVCYTAKKISNIEQLASCKRFKIKTIFHLLPF